MHDSQSPKNIISPSSLVGLFIPTAVFIALALTLRIDPAEDAHIMFRYAQNLSSGYGLVWNVGEDPVEGATEFLWTLIVAGGITFGIDAGLFAQFTACGFAIATLVLMQTILLRFYFVRLTYTVAATTLVAVSPIVVQARSGFGTPLFTFLLVLIWFGCLFLLNASASRKKIGGVVTSSAILLLGLTRPEGIFFGALMLLSLFILLPRDERTGMARSVLWFCIIPGILYFLWRWQYFGWLLPNTFYAKSGTEIIHTNGFAPILRFFWIALPIVILMYYHVMHEEQDQRRKYSWMLLPVVMFPWFYLLIEQMQNIGMRFQFPVFPLLLLCFAVAAEKIARVEFLFTRNEFLKLFALVYVLGILIWIAPMLGGSNFSLSFAGASAIVAIVVFLLWSYQNFFPPFLERTRLNTRSLFFYLATFFMLMNVYALTTQNTAAEYDHRVRMGKALSVFAEKKYTMATTEAGWLPYFSRWKAVDPFGLYDEYIAHHGLDEKYLDVIAPELIIFHVYSDAYKQKWVHGDERWNAMTQKLYHYARSHQYRLAARVGVHHDCFWYFVKKECPDADSLESLIAHQEGMQYTTPVEE